MFENFNFFGGFFNNDFEKNFNHLNNKKFNFDETNEDEIPSGDIKITTGESESGNWEKREWISSDGLTKMTSYSYTSKSSEPVVNKKLLKEKIKLAVEKEDYETAAKLKKELESLEKNN